MQTAKIITQQQITFFVDGIPYMLQRDVEDLNAEKRYKAVLKALSENDYQAAVEAFNEDQYHETVSMKALNEINKVADGVLRFDEEGQELYYREFKVPEELTKRINEIFERDNTDIKSLALFFNRLIENPDQESISELFDFLAKNNLPITERGTFLAYKSVEEDYKDSYSKTIDNSVGAQPSMPRQLVDSVRTNTCSNGFHFCSIEYLKSGGFGYVDDKPLMVLEIDPKDVVSIPTDYNFSKGRCSTYKVVSEVPEEVREKLFGLNTHQNNIWGSDVLDDEDFDDFEEDLEEYEEDLVNSVNLLRNENDEEFENVYNQQVTKTEESKLVVSDIEIPTSLIRALTNLASVTTAVNEHHVAQIMLAHNLHVGTKDRLEFAELLVEALIENDYLTGELGNVQLGTRKV